MKNYVRLATTFFVFISIFFHIQVAFAGKILPPTVNIIAVPETIPPGESTVLTWGSTNADTCIIEPDIGSVPVNGSVAVSPEQTTTYVITAVGSRKSATASVTVTVSGIAPITTLSAEPSSIISGSTSLLSWNSLNAESAVIDNGIGAVPVSGTIEVSPLQTTDYTITVTGANGTATASARVTVVDQPPPPTIHYFTVTPETVYGCVDGWQHVRLNWSTSNAGSVVIDHGVGDVVYPTGNKSVFLNTTTTFTLTATGPGGVETASVTANVVNTSPLSYPQIVTKGSVDQGLNNPKMIVRSSSGQIYYFNYDADPRDDWFGGVEVNTSADGNDWEQLAQHNEWYKNTPLGAALDSKDVVHAVSFNWNKQLYYEKFNTIDSLKSDHSWEGLEIIDSVSSIDGFKPEKCAIAIDANDIPHIVFTKMIKSSGKIYVDTYYANRVGGAWNKMRLTREIDIASINPFVDIVIGPDNIPYILFDDAVLRGDANNPAGFEDKDLGTKNYSIAIHTNGDVRVAVSTEDYYGNFLHDATQDWSSGWELSRSDLQANEGTLVLVDDIPYFVTNICSGVAFYKEFEPPVLVALSGSTYDAFGPNPITRWSFYNHHDPAVIDLGLRYRANRTYDRNFYYYANFFTRLNAGFSANTNHGVAAFEVQFTDVSNAEPGNQIISWEWDFNNDGIVDSIEQNPTHVFTTVGQYTVSLTVMDSEGNSHTTLKEDFIKADTDSDNDEILDFDDNCIGEYNQNQIDLDNDGIGYACDDNIQMLDQAISSVGLVSITGREINTTDVTIQAADGLLGKAIHIKTASRDNDVFSILSNVEATDLSSLSLKIYVNNLENGLSQGIHIYGYNADKTSINLTSQLDFTISPGWNDLDVSALLPLMNGFGFVKFRVAATDSWVDISEAWLSGTSDRGVDDYDITATPTAVDFGSIIEGNCEFATVAIANTGSGELVLGAITFPGRPFSIIEENCSDHTLTTNGSSCNLTLAFCPSEVGFSVDSLSIPSNDADNPTLQVAVTGNALANQTTLAGVVTDEMSTAPVSGANISVQSFWPHYDFEPSQYVYTPGESWVTAEDYEKARYNDGEKVMSTSFISTTGTAASHMFKVRNLYSTTNPIKITWNGVGDNINYDVRILGQSFKAGQTGVLSDVSLSLGQGPVYSGIARVYLMKEIGGEQDAILAESDYILTENIPTSFEMINFHFSNPAEVTAGESYCIILISSGACRHPIEIHWQRNTSNTYRNGSGYERWYANWSSGNDFIFTTYVDSQIDQQNTIGNTTTSVECWYYNNNNTTRLSIYNQVLGQWETLAFHSENSCFADVTLTGIIEDNPADYYDSEGWISVSAMYSDSIFTTDTFAISTDLFLVEFIENDDTSTDASGAYSVSGLLPGDYTISSNKVGFHDKTETGTIVAGTTQTYDLQLASVPPLELAITSPSDGEVFSSTNIVTVTGTFTNNPQITVNGIIAAILPDNIFSETVTPSAGEFIITATASDEFGQVESASVKVVVEGGSVAGTVTEASTGLPLPSANVRISSGINNFSTYSNADGYYSLPLAPAGENTLSFIKSGYVSLSTPITVTTGESYTFNAALERVGPTLSGITESEITINSAVIRWSTDQAATSRIVYGKSVSYGLTVEDPALVTDHTILLTGLEPGTLYHYKISSANSDGQIGESGDLQFTTLGPTVSIYADQPNIIIGESALLTWTSTGADVVSIDNGIGAVAATGSLSVTPAETTTYTITITAVNPDATVTESITVAVTWPQPVVTFSADISSVPAGEPVTLTWEISYAQSVSVDQGIGPVALGGATVVNPLVTTTYTIIATGPGGTTTQNITITVLAPPTVNFFAFPESIMRGNSSTLTWDFTNTTSITIDQGIGDVSSLNSIDVTPTETTTYTITAIGPGGTTTAVATVTVTYPTPTVHLTGEQQVIQAGESTTLIWETTDADTVTIDNGIGAVAANGSITASPTETTLYTITATSPGGTAVGWVRIFVPQAGGYSYGDPTPAEQAHLEAINRTRMDPAAEAERLGFDLYEGLLEGTINSTPRQPVVLNANLLQAAALHAQDMIDNQFFGHNSLDGSTPYDRIPEAGYQYSKVAENIGGFCMPDPYPSADAALEIHANLFIDTGVEGRGHRLNILDNSYKEIGIGMAAGPYLGDPHCFMMTDDYALSLNDSRSFIMGVVYDDRNNDNIYTAGEGMGNVVIDVVEAGDQTTTASAGGYGIPLDPGTYTVTATLPGGFTVSKQITIAEENIKVDFLFSEFNVAPPVANFSSDVLDILPGDSVTLSWSSEHAYSATLNNGIGAVPTTGSITVSPNLTTTYTINLEGMGGTVTVDLTILVSETPPPTAHLSAMPRNLQIGEYTTLLWNSYYADTCEIAPGIGPVSLSGSMDITPETSTAYTLTCTNSMGNASDNVMISYPMPTAAITAKPQILISGQNTTLSWQTTDATAVTIDNGIGAVASTGTLTVSPAATMTYTITAVGPGGTVSDTVTVTSLDNTTLGVAVTYPAEGETLHVPVTVVKGLVVNSGDEVGVTVNGHPAQVDGDIWFVNNLPLEEGENVLDVTATSKNGETATFTRSIFLDTSVPAEWIRLWVTSQSGVAPLQVTLTAKPHLFTTLVSSTVIAEGINAADITAKSNTEYDLVLTTPGFYTLIYQAMDDQGRTLKQEIMVNVLDQNVFDAFLRAKWDVLKAALSNQNIETASSYFAEETRTLYYDIYSSLFDNLPVLVQDMQDIQLIYADQDKAKYRIRKNELVNGQLEEITYYIYFTVDSDGLWKIFRY
ncbi:MAG: carboxypeptidase-like regulatory domain-containing protein [Desulfobulbaceae bacterium]|nr:carboxypeptidase-like regulatory domain-containing protein [Desulfobulbaceae bacterium]